MGNESSSSHKVQEPVENDISVSWNQVSSSISTIAVDGHCSAAGWDAIYVFGGIRFNGNDGSESSLLYKFCDGSWSQVTATGDIPAARSAASLTAVDKFLFLIGGVSHVSGWLNDVNRFNTETRVWEKINSTGDIPSPRDKSACVTIGNKIYLFGGFGPQPTEDAEEDDEEWESDEEEQEAAHFGWFKDLFVLDTDSATWTRPTQLNLCGPTPRAACAMCAVGDVLVVFGGKAAEGRTNDIHFFNTVSHKWEPRALRGKAPCARSFHSMCCVSDTRLCVFGGRAADNSHLNDLHVLDAELGAWMQVRGRSGAVWPAARALHSLTCSEQQLVLHGGSSDLDPETMQCRHFYSDTWTLQLAELRQGGATQIIALSDDKENSAQMRPATPTKPIPAQEDVSPPKIRRTDTS